MTIRVAINGYGRIGRNVLRALYENYKGEDIKIVAINNMASGDHNVHLTKYDTTHGRFNADVHHDGENIVVNGDKILMCADRAPENLPWKELGVDVVHECTGKFKNKDEASAHLAAGAKKVLISAPASGEIDATVVYGVNHDIIRPEHTVISNASCTTNCLAPVVKVLNDAMGVDHGMMLTVHAYTNDQNLIDANHKDLHRARAAAHSIIPTKTGAASAVGIVIPELNGKLDGYATRVPVINVSLVDFTFKPKRAVTVDEINQVMRDAAAGPLKGVLAISDEPLVSTDFNHHPASSIFDTTQTRVLGEMVKVVAWYDNEWGFSNRMIDVTKLMML